MTIKNVSFSGKLMFSEGVDKQLSKAHKNYLINYAVEKNCDVFVFSAKKPENRTVKVSAYVLDNNNLELKEQEIKLKTVTQIKNVKPFWKKLAL